MPDFHRKYLPHDVPFWIDPTQEAYFITINCDPRGVNQLAKPTIWNAIRETIEFREQREEWQWSLVLAMPDHLHGIVTFPNKFSLSRSIGQWKRWMASQHAIVWQRDFFDHRLRSLESTGEKAGYIRMNPVRANLVADPKDWPYARDWKTT